MEPISAAKMAEADRRAIQELGISQGSLMENAGLKVFESVMQLWGCPRKVCALCGKGNNGGDAAIAAEHFRKAGASVAVIRADAANALSSLEDALRDSDLVMDGLFGTGLKKPITGDHAAMVEMINRMKPCPCNLSRQNYRVVSVDLPSGLNADTGEVMGACVASDLTVTFHAVKAGMLTSRGINLAGRIVVADIGIPYEPGQLFSKDAVSLADHSHVKKSLLFRKTYSNKSDNGRILMIAGSPSMAGAAILSARAALRSGAGLVYLSVPKRLQDHVNTAVPEAITHADIAPESIRSLRLSAVAAGPGMGTSKKSALKALLKEPSGVPLILDADALNILASDRAVATGHKRPLVLTPHPGEMARLLKADVDDIQSDRIAAARKASSMFNAFVVLKGLNTVVCDPSGKCCIVSAGNPSLACGGSGDVLSGIMTAMIGQGADVFDCCVAACFIHGMASDIVRSIKGETGVTPSDIIEAIPYLIKGCCDGKQKNS